MENVEVEPLPVLGSTGGAKEQPLDEIWHFMRQSGFLYVDPLMDSKVADQMVKESQGG